MRKLFAVTFLFTSFSLLAESGDYYEDKLDGWTVDVFVRTSFFAFDNTALKKINAMGAPVPLVQGLAALDGLALGFGLGYGLEIIPDILIPGIYLDCSFSPFALTMTTVNGELMPPFEDFFPLAHIGLRVYNQFKITSFDIEPFAGFNAAFEATNKCSLFSVFGILASFKFIGIEYTYCLPFMRQADWESFRGAKFHRISLCFHVR
ncbi:MAG: hypothetical protein LBG72_07110 [Spirochaetaceae bacterium]|nr:hypothetical protein [Spirochaetaceae bacterium]